MFLYFDKQGVLREIVNDDKVRLGSFNQNTIYCYFEDENFDDIYATFQHPDGTIEPEVSILSNNTSMEIPYDKNRDLKYFEDYKEYDFYYYDINTTSKGLALFTVRTTYGNEISAKGMVTLNVEENIIKADHEITQSQYDYLISFVGNFNGRIEENAEEILKLKTRTDSLEKNDETQDDKLSEHTTKLSQIFTTIEFLKKNKVEIDNSYVPEWKEENVGKVFINISEGAKKGLIYLVTDDATNPFILLNKSFLEVNDMQSTLLQTVNRVGVNETDIIGLKANKLDKVYEGLPMAQSLASNDYFVINSGNVAYKVRASLVKEKEDHYKGDFTTLDALKTIVGSNGDYAFVNTTIEQEDGTFKDMLVMYIWDEDEKTWKETTSDKYVKTVIFDEFQKAYLDFYSQTVEDVSYLKGAIDNRATVFFTEEKEEIEDFKGSLEKLNNVMAIFQSKTAFLVVDCYNLTAEKYETLVFDNMKYAGYGTEFIFEGTTQEYAYRIYYNTTDKKWYSQVEELQVFSSVKTLETQVQSLSEEVEGKSKVDIIESDVVEKIVVDNVQHTVLNGIYKNENLLPINSAGQINITVDEVSANGEATGEETPLENITVNGQTFILPSTELVFNEENTDATAPVLKEIIINGEVWQVQQVLNLIDERFVEISLLGFETSKQYSIISQENYNILLNSNSPVIKFYSELDNKVYYLRKVNVDFSTNNILFSYIEQNTDGTIYNYQVLVKSDLEIEYYKFSQIPQYEVVSEYVSHNSNVIYLSNKLDLNTDYIVNFTDGSEFYNVPLKTIGTDGTKFVSDCFLIVDLYVCNFVLSVERNILTVRQYESSGFLIFEFFAESVKIYKKKEA